MGPLVLSPAALSQFIENQPSYTFISPSAPWIAGNRFFLSNDNDNAGTLTNVRALRLRSDSGTNLLSNRIEGRPRTCRLIVTLTSRTHSTAGCVRDLKTHQDGAGKGPRDFKVSVPDTFANQFSAIRNYLNGARNNFYHIRYLLSRLNYRSPIGRQESGAIGLHGTEV